MKSKKTWLITALTIIFIAVVAFVCPKSSGKAEQTFFNNLDELKGKNLGVITGASTIGASTDYFGGDIELSYFSSTSDMVVALRTGKIDAYVGNIFVCRMQCATNTDQKVIDTPIQESPVGFTFAKNDAHAAELCDQMNAMIAEFNESGKVKELEDKWMDSEKHTIDVQLTGENGTLRYACTSSIGKPFCFMQDNELVGCEVELVTLFCERYGYDLELVDYDIGGMLAAVASGKADLGGTNTMITEERQKQCLFSEPYRQVALVAVVNRGAEAEKIYTCLDDLEGTTIAGLIGAEPIPMVVEYFDGNITIEYYNSETDMAVAVESDKAEAYITNLYTGKLLCQTYTDQTVLEDTPIQVCSAGFMFTPNSERGSKLCAEMNAFIEKCTNNGKFDELIDKWVNGHDQTIDIELTGENGTVKFACCTGTCQPYCYVQDNNIVGLDVEIAYLFCKEYGYDIEIADYDISGMIAAVASSKADFAGSNTCITEERQKQCLFSNPYRPLPYVLVVKNGTAVVEETDFLKSIFESFYNNFILESRYKLVLSGISVTLLITIMSIILGSVLGLGMFFASYDGKIAVNRVIDFLMWLVHGMPVVVFLMVLYYIIFGKSTWSGTTISIIAFTIIFAFACVKMLRGSYRAIPYEQTEAAIALGYSPFKALRRRILPQMFTHLRSSYEGEIVSLLKSTSIVGYIAVQDLTKASDIIRGRTYEPFFPLIATTVIYFILAAILKGIITRLFRLFDTRRRSQKQILKGVDAK